MALGANRLGAPLRRERALSELRQPAIASRARHSTLTHMKTFRIAFPMLSDHMRKVSELYGVLIPQMGIANRVTFVIDTDGKIVNIDEGAGALDPTGAETACSRTKHKK